MCPLAWDRAGDPAQDPSPLPDLEPEPDKPDELQELCLDPQPVPEPELEEEEELDHEWRREGDLVHLHLVGEYATGRNGRRHWRNALTLGVCQQLTQFVQAL